MPIPSRPKRGVPPASGPIISAGRAFRHRSRSGFSSQQKDLQSGWDLKMRVLPRSGHEIKALAAICSGGFFRNSFAAWADSARSRSRAVWSRLTGRPERTEVDRRWIPSASLYTMPVSGRPAQPLAWTAIPRPTGTGIRSELLWSIGGTADMASPVILDVPGKPRGCSRMRDVGFVYSLEDPITTEGDPGRDNRSCKIGSGHGGRRSPTIGSSVRAEAKPLVLSGGDRQRVLEFEVLRSRSCGFGRPSNGCIAGIP